MTIKKVVCLTLTLYHKLLTIYKIILIYFHNILNLTSFSIINSISIISIKINGNYRKWVLIISLCKKIINCLDISLIFKKSKRIAFSNKSSLSIKNYIFMAIRYLMKDYSLISIVKFLNYLISSTFLTESITKKLNFINKIFKCIKSYLKPCKWR